MFDRKQYNRIYNLIHRKGKTGNKAHRPQRNKEEDNEKDPILRAKKIKEWCEEINKKYHNPKEELCTR